MTSAGTTSCTCGSARGAGMSGCSGTRSTASSEVAGVRGRPAAGSGGLGPARVGRAEGRGAGPLALVPAPPVQVPVRAGVPALPGGGEVRYVALDCESHLIKPGCLAPRLVCVSWAEGDRSGVLERASGLSMVRDLLRSDAHLVLHNGQFDFGVFVAEDPDLLPLVFNAYEDGRVRDTLTRQKLLDVADGTAKFRWVKNPDGTAGRAKTTYHLDALVLRHLGRTLPKADTFRLRYHELDGVPVDRWPEEARKYAVDDAVATLEVFQAQERELDDDELPNERKPTRASWALHLMSLWGGRTDPKAVGELVARLEAEVAEARAKLIPTGIYRPNGTRDMAVVHRRLDAAYKAKGLEVPITPTGAVSTAGQYLKASGDPDLELLAKGLEAADQLSDWGKWLEAGTRAPICARYDVLKETGRTGCAQPNMQNPPRKGAIRSCFA